MRRIISLFTVFVFAAALFSCNDKKDDITPEKPENVVTESAFESGGDTVVSENADIENASEESGSAAAEEGTSQKRIISSDEFRSINVSTVFTGEKADCEIKSYDLRGMDFGERIPVCNRAENAEKFYEGMKGDRIVDLDDMEYRARVDWHDYSDKPEKGFMINSFADNGKIYLLVDYGLIIDNSNSHKGCYDWALFSYDTGSGRTDEVYSWSSDAVDKYCSNVILRDNEVFCCISRGEKVYVNVIDLSSGKERTVFEKESGSERFALTTGSRFSLIFATTSTDTVFLVETIEELSYSHKQRMYYYDSDNDCFAEDYIRINPFFSSGGTISTDEYEFNVSEGSIGLIYMEKDRLYFYGNDCIETYDLEKNECYMNSMSDIDFFYEIGVKDGKIFLLGRDLKCLIPEQGLIFDVLDSGEYQMSEDNGRLVVTDFTSGCERLYVIK
ncbi:hypothetical protein [Ruminococcus sp.]|uniref:hypothetical protein n=1 Tax=Ruminococcus sp. TaxID=41978 RepID=UPI0025EB2F56|nr:hypothetical protein [Ruminococcus sp.]